jgi:hypothetical protein
VKRLKKILKGLFLLFCLIVISNAVIKKLLTPTENPNFHSEEDYNNIILKKEDQMIIEEQNIGAIAGTAYTKYLVVYDREYIGYVLYDWFYSMGSEHSYDTILKLDDESQSKIHPSRKNYYLSKYSSVSESDYYFREESGNKKTRFVSLLKNSVNAKDRKKEGLNFIKQEERYYFQDRTTGKNLIEITFLKKKTKVKILSDKVSDYPTSILIYLSYLTHHAHRLNQLLKMED